MDPTQISKMIEQELDLKDQLKQLRQEIKAFIEGTEFYQGMLNHAMDIPDIELNEKTAAAHAFKVTYETFAPPKEPKPKKSKKNSK